MTADERIESEMLRPETTEPISAVYFLSDGEHVVYVGQSTNVKRRIAQHSDNIEFAYAWHEPCDPRDLIRLESEAIQKYSGPHLLNKRGTPSRNRL